MEQGVAHQRAAANQRPPANPTPSLVLPVAIQLDTAAQAIPATTLPISGLFSWGSARIRPEAPNGEGRGSLGRERSHGMARVTVRHEGEDGNGGCRGMANVLQRAEQRNRHHFRCCVTDSLRARPPASMGSEGCPSGCLAIAAGYSPSFSEYGTIAPDIASAHQVYLPTTVPLLTGYSPAQQT